MRKVTVAGVGLVKVSEHWDKPIGALFADAALQAMKDAGTDDIDSLYVSNMSGTLMQEQLNMGALMAEASRSTRPSRRWPPGTATACWWRASRR